MDIPFTSRFKRGWNAFLGRDPTPVYKFDYGYSSSYRLDKTYFRPGLEKTIVTTICNRIALDCASVDIFNVRVDKEDRFKEVIKSPLNECLTLEANIDQTGPAMIQDLTMSMFDEGCIAVVPIDTSSNPDTGAFDIYQLRVGKIVQWYSYHIKVNVYNELTGKFEDITVSKETTAIIENPLYAIMNEPNSTLQRLIRTLGKLDKVNDSISSEKMNLLIQLPYITKSDNRRIQAEERIAKIESQLVDSKYGIAYLDGTEKVIQLNRPLENNLWQQAQDLKTELYNQLGLSESIFNGTADEKEMLNYYNRTIDPILRAIALEFKRKFLSKTARTQGQSIMYFRDPFRLVTANDLAEIADKMTRNAILSSNEIRCEIGYKPIDDPRADELRNKNLNAEEGVDAMTTRDNVSSKNQNNSDVTENDVLELIKNMT